MTHGCIIRNISNVLQQWKTTVPYIRPFYKVSIKSHPPLLQHFANSNIGFVCGSSTQIHNAAPYVCNASPYVCNTAPYVCNASPYVCNTAPYVCNAIICNTPTRTNIEILYSKHSRVSEYTVANIDEMKKVHTFMPNAAFWVKTNVSPNGVSNAKQMLNYIWENKCIYNGLFYNIDNFSTGHIPPSMYSHKIALDYIDRTVLSYADEIGLRTYMIHIDGGREFINASSLTDIHSVFNDAPHILRNLERRGISLQASVDTLFDLRQPG